MGNTMKFKAGDKIRRFKHPYPGYNESGNSPKLGYIYTFVFYTSSYNKELVVKELDGLLSAECFELVKENMTELEQLVKHVNDGEDARRIIIKKYINEVEYKVHEFGGDYKPLNGSIDTYILKIKEKPKFKPFQITGDLNVGIFGEELHIGCQKFIPDLAKGILEDLLKYNVSFTQRGNDFFKASRKGIIYNGYLLLWSDAEKILNALEEMDKK